MLSVKSRIGYQIRNGNLFTQANVVMTLKQTITINFLRNEKIMVRLFSVTDKIQAFIAVNIFILRNGGALVQHKYCEKHKHCFGILYSIWPLLVGKHECFNELFASGNIV